MSEKISDIFDYGDEIVVTEEQVDWIDTARIKELTMNKIKNEAYGTHEKKARPVYRTILIAAVVAALLVGGAMAVYQYSMQDRAITVDSDVVEEGYMQKFSPVGYTTETESDTEEASHFIGSGEMQISSADSTNREYLALEEWMEYFWMDHEEDLDVLLDMDNPYRFYGIGYEGVAEHLQSIADKYELRLYQNQTLTNDLDEFFDSLGAAPFLTMQAGDDGIVVCAAYDDGSFKISGAETPVEDSEGNTELGLNIYCAVKGSFCDFNINGDSPEEYTYEQYTTSDGQSVDLALGSRYSMIFAELSDCWVTIEVYGGTVGSEYLPVIGMDTLQQIADNVDFSLLSAGISAQ